MELKLLHESLLAPGKSITSGTADDSACVPPDIEIENADACGACGKPFSVVRKRRSISRLTYGGDVTVLFVSGLCGTCTLAIRNNGNVLPDRVKRDAEAACAEFLANAEGAA